MSLQQLKIPEDMILEMVTEMVGHKLPEETYCFFHQDKEKGSWYISVNWEEDDYYE